MSCWNVSFGVTGIFLATTNDHPPVHRADVVKYTYIIIFSCLLYSIEDKEKRKGSTLIFRSLYRKERMVTINKFNIQISSIYFFGVKNCDQKATPESK